MKRRKISGYINIYSKKVKDQIMQVGDNFFMSEGLPTLSEQLFPCIDELIKNAIKANYKFILIMDRIRDEVKKGKPSLQGVELSKEILAILHDKNRFESMAGPIIAAESLSAEVRRILNEESTHIKIRDKMYREHRAMTDDEIASVEQLRYLTGIKTKLKNARIKIILKIESDGEFVFIEVTNTAPILANDLKRIHEKRDEFRKYLEEGREHEFFIFNMDTSDSGFGLGYATIDSILKSIGLDPYNTIQILAASDTTVILSFPITHLKQRAVS